MPPEGTPAAPAAPAAAPLAIPQQAPQQTRSTKAYSTRPKTHAAPAAPAAAPAPVAPAATPAAQKPAETAPAAAAPETPAAATPPAPEAPKTLTPGEEAKRLAQLSRTEQRVVAEKQKLAQERESLLREQQSNAANLKRIELLTRARETPAGPARLALIRQVFGWSPTDLMSDVIGETTRTPEQVASERVSTIDQKTAELTRKIEEFDKRAEGERQAAQVNTYIQSNIAPVLTPKDFPFLCNELGANAARQMYDVMNEEYRKSGVAPDVKKLAAQAEAWYRKDAETKAKLLGLSVTAPQQANPAAPGGTASTPTTQQSPSTPLRNRFQSAPTFRAKHRTG